MNKSNSNKNKLSKIIGLGFFVSIPFILYLFNQADDHGLFLPRTELIDSIIPDFFIYLKSDYELRCFEGLISFWIIFYFIILGILNTNFWKNNNKKKLRIGHAIITIGLVFFFFLTMVEEDVFHELKIENFNERQQYENKVAIFYQLFFVWSIVQIIYFAALFEDTFLQKNG